MNQSNQYTILTLVAIVAFIAGQAMQKKCTCNQAQSKPATQPNAATQEQGSMDWFANWAGM